MPQDYNEAIQSPQHCFEDSDLRTGRVELNRLGLPKAASGAFASVYKVTTATGDWAVRCFLTARRDQGDRYKLISEYVLFDDLDCTVDFHFVEKGIKVGGQWYPIVKMPWIEGPTLDVYVHQIKNDRSKLLALKDDFYNLSMALETAGIAHGDLQHGNIIVSPNGLRLVDYDAFFVPALLGRLSLEFGHPNYQHPLRDEYYFDVSVDNFSSWLIHSSLVAMTIDPELFALLEGGDDCILFKRADLRSPETSKAFATLLAHESEQLREIGNLLLRMLWLPPHMVPALDASPEDLAKLPKEKPEFWNLQGFGQIDSFEQGSSSSSASGDSNSGSIPSAELAAKRKVKKKETLKEKTSSVFDSMMKFASPGLWISHKTKQADNYIAEGLYERGSHSLLQVRELQMRSFPHEKNLELTVLIRLAYCSSNLNAKNQADNYCMNAAQLAGKNAKLLQDVTTESFYAPGMVLFYTKLSTLLFAIARKGDEEQETFKAFTDLVSQGADLTTTAESQNIMTGTIELFLSLITGGVIVPSEEDLRSCTRALLRYQGTWAKTNGHLVYMANYDRCWKSQVTCAYVLAKLCADQQLIMRAVILSRACAVYPFEEPSQFFKDCFENQELFKIVIQESIRDLGMANVMKCLMPSLRTLRREIALHDFVGGVMWLWAEFLRNEQEYLVEKISVLGEFKYDVIDEVLTDEMIELVLDQVKIEFGFERRMNFIGDAIRSTARLGDGPGLRLRNKILDKLMELVRCNYQQISESDVIRAHQLIVTYAQEGTLLWKDAIEKMKKWEK
jgi:hypothetical protein